MKRMATASPKVGTTEMTGAHEPRQRPDPRPMRLVLGLGGLAALSALVGAVVAPPAPIVAVDGTGGASDAATASPGTAEAAAGAAAGASLSPAGSTAGEPPTIVQHVTRYIYLAPGQTPPPQALVTRLQAPTPRPTAAPKTSAPAPATAAPRKRVIIVTSQSGGKP